jgi:hypothetical protein
LSCTATWKDEPYSEALRRKIVEAVEEAFAKLKALLCAEPGHVPARLS